MKRAILFFLWLIMGCSLTPELKINTPNIPEQIKIAHFSSNIDLKNNWWEELNDPILNRLIEDGLKNNKEIKTAEMKIDIALATLGIEKATLYPETKASSNIARQSVSQEVSPYKKSVDNYFNLGASLSYELDFWGKLKAQREIAKSNLKISVFDKQHIANSLVATIANIYIQIRANEKVLSLLDKHEKLHEETVAFRKKQLELGVISEYIFEQANALLLNIKNQRLQIIENTNILKNSLSFLVSKDPQTLTNFDINTTTADLTPFSLPTNLPSTFLLKRPDINAAIEKIISANYNIAVAKSLYFPNITLTANTGFASSDLTNIAQSSANFWNIGSIIYLPIFDFGKIKNTVRKSELSRDIEVINYEKTVENAFKEVNEALIKIRSIYTRLEHKKDELNSHKKLLEISKKYFETGKTSILDLIEAERNYISKEVEMITLKKELILSQIEFYKALGLTYQ
ncbi:MAG: TolC family protein [Calditerrivibrio sp.]|nr:TolC family protein [Calditerrivibrio sp.]